MRCPKCRREIAVEATTHECGWSVSSSATRVKMTMDEPRASREVIEASLEKIRKILHAPKRERPASGVPVKVERERVAMVSDVGHGTECVCEVCWRLRTQREVEVRVEAASEVRCPKCGGNDADLPCAYPGECALKLQPDGGEVAQASAHEIEPGTTPDVARG